MGIADAFNREDRIEIKVISFIEMTQKAAKAEVMSELLMNAVKCEVPYRYIRETMSGASEGEASLVAMVDKDNLKAMIYPTNEGETENEYPTNRDEAEDE